MAPTLFLLAAGMGSRYGGLKQLDPVGPHGEAIMDYSIYDALSAGFGRIVWVIRRDFEDLFREQVLSRYETQVPCAVCFQSLDSLPEGFTVPEGRTKPWGTNHAVLMGKDIIHEPFAVINCDDFYGRDAFRVMGQWLSALPEGSTGRYAMVGFRVDNTLSDSGTVSRGICENDNVTHHLTSVVERTKIERHDGRVEYLDDAGQWVAIPESTPVSMNFWGFTPDYFNSSEAFFKQFLSDEKVKANPKAEFFIPLMMDELIKTGKATCEVLATTSQWFGVTYPEDRPEVVARLKALHDSGQYPDVRI